ncbi:hypothetical protein GCM10023322_24480 [Rugosimonospora acidiphila]|uniref:Uncharacterized protein n=1 Tax=Rugosimonospora acidiphila TaxID=556531 RepID=A0ABP9RRU6_9ACTN
MPDKREVHQAKSKGRRKSNQPGSGRGATLVTGPDTAGTAIGLDRSTKQDNAPSAGRAKRGNGR